MSYLSVKTPTIYNLTIKNVTSLRYMKFVKIQFNIVNNFLEDSLPSHCHDRGQDVQGGQTWEALMSGKLFLFRSMAGLVLFYLQDETQRLSKGGVFKVPENPEVASHFCYGVEKRPPIYSLVKLYDKSIKAFYQVVSSCWSCSVSSPPKSPALR